MKLSRKRIEIPSLTEENKANMFALISTYYANTKQSIFDKDLEGKDWALVLLEEETGKIVGFSTQELIVQDFKGKSINVLFSGDTILAREHWGTGSLSLAFNELMIDLLKSYPDRPLYWLLISKGLRTYKYLPNCFIEYYPNWQIETPENITQLMHQLGNYKFNDSYNPDTGIVSAQENGQYLKDEFQPSPEEEKPYESFFFQKNPGYEKGDELLCLTRLSLDNILPSMLEALSTIK